MKDTSGSASTIYLICPACGYKWRAGTLDSARDWSLELQELAIRFDCPACGAAPPMTIRTVPNPHAGKQIP